MSLLKRIFNISIRQKIWLVFVSGVAVYLCVNAYMLYEQYRFKDSFNTIVDEVNPFAMGVLTLQADLEATMQYLSFYLLKKDKQQLTEFDNYLAKLHRRLAGLLGAGVRPER